MESGFGRLNKIHETILVFPMQAATCIRTPFNFESTASDVVERIDLRQKRAIVTGGASGIGIETARALARAGAEVTLAVRDLPAGKRAAADLIRTTGNNHIHVAPLELADFNSIN